MEDGTTQVVQTTEGTPVKTYSEAEYNALQEQLKAMKSQIDTANQTIQSYKDMDIESIKKSADDWKEKYEQAEKDRKAKEYSDALDKFVQKQGMKNDIYASHLKQKLADNQLQFDDKGTLIGGDDIVKALRDECPDAFSPNVYERAAVPTSGSASSGLTGVEAAFYALNPDYREN